MKRFFRNSVCSIIALAATVLTLPAQGQSWGQANGGGWPVAPRQQASANRNQSSNRSRDSVYGNGAYDRGYNVRDERARDTRQSDRRGYDRSNDGRHDDRDRVYRREYAPNNAYVTPGYGYYGNDYDRESRNSRSAAIIGGSTAAGAIIGGAAGHAQGAVVGAVVGGIAGLIADQAVRQHDYR